VVAGDPNTASLRRTRLLRLAVVSSIASKGTAFFFQVISLPIVFHTLDAHSYALYLLVSAVLAMLALAQLGIGSGLTQEIARASAVNDRSNEAACFGTALSMSTLIVVLAGICLFVLVRIPPQHLLGHEYINDHAIILDAARICIPLICVYISLSVVDSALAGYQEQVHVNVGSCVSNVVATGLVYYVCRTDPSLTLIIVATFAPVACMRIANLVLLLRRRPYLVARLGHLSNEPLTRLLRTGSAFWLIQLSSVVEQNVGVLILGHVTRSEELATYGFIYRVVVLGISAVQVVTLPLWPAFVDARMRRDVAWIKQLFKSTRRYLMLFATVLAIGLVALGQPVFLHVLHTDVGDTGRMLIIVFALYCVANIWNHVHYISVMGLGSVWRVAVIIVAENALMAVLGLFLTPQIGVLGMALAYLGASLMLPVWRLPMVLAATFRSIQLETGSRELDAKAL
jgi:O-antigen/teichoic acid export membrane protein